MHQTGEKDLEATAAALRATPASPPTAARSSRTWPPPISAPISIIGRAGATTVAELAIAGKPAIFIPYPFAADNHQELNAREMADKPAPR